MARSATMLQSWRRLFADAASALSASWQRSPRVFLQRETLIRHALTLDALAPLVDSGVLPVGSASIDPQGNSWTSVPLGGPLRAMLAQKTVYANNAGMYVPSLAELCLAGVEELGWPVTCNVYMSGRGLQVSVPPHTDRQDVVVLQTSGEKRWFVWEPPAVGAVGTDPFRRGKDGDILDRGLLGEPVLDTVLAPGDAMYVPLGFPHATSTDRGSCAAHADANEPSVHITLNIDSLIWGLSHRMLWAAAWHTSGVAASATSYVEGERPGVGAPWARYHSLQSPLKFGFLQPSGIAAEPSSQFGEELRARALLWGETPEAAASVSDEHIAAAFAKLSKHREELLQLHRHMYLDVLLDLSGMSPLEREMGHWELLQERMAELRAWMDWE